MFTDSLVAASAGSAGFLTGLAAMRTRVKQATSEAAHACRLADHDALTGLPNRLAAQRHYQSTTQAGLHCTVAILDLDDFKSTNDTWGHQAGDTQVIAIAERLATSSQQLGATAYRLGGDEFAVLTPTTDPEAVLFQITTIVAEVGTALPLIIDDVTTITTFPSASAGIAVADPGRSFSDMLRRADIALYHSKGHHSGPQLYFPELQHPSPAHPRASVAITVA